jgi:hypothetical protein
MYLPFIELSEGSGDVMKEGMSRSRVCGSLSDSVQVGDLRRFSYHTGAPLRALEPQEPCPVLFRDLGLVGMNVSFR